MITTAFALSVGATAARPRLVGVGTCLFRPRFGLVGTPLPSALRGRRGLFGAPPTPTPVIHPSTAVAVTAPVMAADDAPKRHVLVPISDGSEELEAVTIVDTLVRAGAAVTLASVSSSSTTVTCSRGVRLVADAPLGDVATPAGGWDLIAIPGGMPGASTLAASPRLAELLREQKAAGRWIGAICAAPAVVLAPLGLLAGGEAATCYPSADFLAALPNPVEDVFVVSDGRLVTSQGPGTALLFSLCCVEKPSTSNARSSGRTDRSGAPRLLPWHPPGVCRAGPAVNAIATATAAARALGAVAAGAIKSPSRPVQRTL